MEPSSQSSKLVGRHFFSRNSFQDDCDSQEFNFCMVDFGIDFFDHKIKSKLTTADQLCFHFQYLT